jgi:DNA transformation protein and related proteins
MTSSPSSADPAPRGGEYLDYLLDLLRPWAPVAGRRMFGGYGIFRDGVMFGLVIRETLYFRTDDGNRAAYEAAGMGPFTYNRAGRVVSLAYHAVPPDLLDGGEDLVLWAESAYAAALRARRQRPRARIRR